MNDVNLIYKPFISEPKSLIVAPAGHGKTHCIVESLNLSENNQLILTHTNAGIDSIKEKIRNKGVKTNCSVETICGFAQKYVEAFILMKNIPEQDSTSYFPFIITSAIELFNKIAIKQVIRANYAGLFVDEYQDCSKSQHQLISVLAEILPTHILGDPLQGIFNFNNEDLVDFESDLADYKRCTELEKPWRWAKSNVLLGEDLKKLRQTIQNNKIIQLSDFKAFENYFCDERGLYNFNHKYNKELWKIIRSEESLLIIHPISHNFNARLKLVKTFNNSFYLIEAMDANEFYSLAKKIDESDSTSIYSVILEISLNLFNKSETTKWLGENKLKSKRNCREKFAIGPLEGVLDKLSKQIHLKLVAQALKLIKELPKNKCYRTELYYDLLKALELAYINNKCVFDAMKDIRDSKRRTGRKIKGKCIGTTLLTKGLEFDAVVILNAHLFNCPKNFYVALTRASKRLVIFSAKNEISFK